MHQLDYGGYKHRFLGVQFNVLDLESLNTVTNSILRREQVPSDINFQNISYRTVYNHELRHFIDANISPVGNYAFLATVIR